MKRKIICVIISVLFFCTIIPMTSAVINKDTIESPESEPIGGYFIFGFMKLMDSEESITDFEIVSFIFLIGNGEFIRLNEGEMIEIHEPIFGIIFNNLFMGYIGDYSMIG